MIIDSNGQNNQYDQWKHGRVILPTTKWNTCMGDDENGWPVWCNGFVNGHNRNP